MTQLYESLKRLNSAGPALKTILIYQQMTPASPHLAQIKQLFPTVIYRPPNEENSIEPTLEELLSIDVLFSFHIPRNLTNYKQVPALKLFQLFSAGHEHVTKSDFYTSIPEESKLVIASATGIHAVTIGEHIISTLMMLYHRLNELVVIGAVDKRWAPSTEFNSNARYIQEIRGQTIGFIGYGAIARESARMAQSLGADIIACTRDGKKTRAKGYKMIGTGDEAGLIPTQYYSSENEDQLTEFLNRCDVVVNTLPLSAGTRNFIGERELKEMKGNAIFINIGRGGTTALAPLIDALQAKPGNGEEESATGTLRIGGASLDVTEPEPLPQGHILFTLPNVVLTPHMSGLSKTYDVRAVDLMLQNVERLKKGKGCINAVRGRGE